MRINQNISAVLANDQLLRNENSVSESVRRLSSGMKFNSAKDNPSGVAISYKMQAQINALTRASSNTTDGISIVQTIDGAMGETVEIIQRINELCIQAANGTNALKDREAIQLEIDSLKKEIDRMATDTEFNGKTLLDGSLDRRTYVTTEENGAPVSLYDEVQNIIISDEVEAGHYSITIEQTGRRAEHIANGNPTGQTTITAAQAGVIEINGSMVEITEGMTAKQVYNAIRDAAEVGGVDVFSYDAAAGQNWTEDTLDSQGYEKKEFNNFGDPLVFLSEGTGSSTEMSIVCTNKNLANLLGLDPSIQDEEGNYIPSTYYGKDAEISLDFGDFSVQATKKAEGNRITISDRNGFEMSFELQADLELRIAQAAGPVEIDIEATDMGTLQLQIGANEDQEMEVRVPVITTRSLYIDDLDVTKVDGGTRGISQADKALTIVSAARAKMGAYQNRLEHAQKSLNATIEDMTTAISRLADVDMAEEMTTYTNSNVLNQASISVLSQANDLPQQVLSLLRG